MPDDLGTLDDEAMARLITRGMLEHRILAKLRGICPSIGTGPGSAAYRLAVKLASEADPLTLDVTLDRYFAEANSSGWSVQGIDDYWEGLAKGLQTPRMQPVVKLVPQTGGHPYRSGYETTKKPGGAMRSESRARTSRELDLAVMLVLVGYFIDYLVHRI